MGSWACAEDVTLWKSSLAAFFLYPENWAHVELKDILRSLFGRGLTLELWNGYCSLLSSSKNKQRVREIGSVGKCLSTLKV